MLYIYLADIVESINTLFCLLAFFFLCATCAVYPESYIDENKILGNIPRKSIGILSVIFVIIATLIPTKEAIYLMVGIHNLAPIVEKLSPTAEKTLTLVNKYLEESLSKE